MSKLFIGISKVFLGFSKVFLQISKVLLQFLKYFKRISTISNVFLYSIYKFPKYF
jgi:hypothetical protein